MIFSTRTMRSIALLLAASSCAHATWLRWSVNREPVWAAQETARITESDPTGWTPIPTPAPGVRSDGDIVLDLLRRQKSTTDWTNSETCGWYSGISSSAFECGTDFTCATNEDHVIACTSGTFKPFFSACLDFSAFQAGSCASLDSATGCCQNSAQPACGTYLWTGEPERSMYKCFETASILTMLDVPQFVVDASLFSKTHTTPEPTSTGTDGSASPSGSTGGSDAGSGGSNSSNGSNGDSGSDGGQGASGSNGSNGASGSNSGSTNNTPIIVGSVIGGIAGLLLLLLLLFCLHRKAKGKLGLSYTRNKHNKQKDHNVYHTSNQTAPVVKGRSSSGSEAMAVVSVPSQQPQHHYYSQEQNHYHPQAQVQPQQYQQQPPPPPPPQYQAGGQQPVSMSYTVNEGATHVSRPSYSHTSSHTSSYTAMPANSSSGAPPQFVVGGIVPVSHQACEKQQYQQPQPQFQQQFQQQPQGPQSQLQPVNHIHVYYTSPPMQPSQPAQPAQPAQPSDPTPETHDAVPDALGLYTQYQAHGPGYRQSF
ncbi:hypothetical protein F5Y09DRAFT_300103 [Xylaria sp. FL1042]|nr:hypothetical protein F5Y09DRAFT_300103 [Xylaria sp. FL1042]